MKEEVKRWLKQAEDDLDTAGIDFNNGKYKAASFWCQQALEKGFKALLICVSNKFPKIHDLTKLVELNSAPPRIKEICAKIDPAYTASRYPDAAVHYSKDECEEILKGADEAFAWIKEKLD